jgi:hypothetical protein
MGGHAVVEDPAAMGGHAVVDVGNRADMFAMIFPNEVFAKHLPAFMEDEASPLVAAAGEQRLARADRRCGALAGYVP